MATAFMGVRPYTSWIAPWRWRRGDTRGGQFGTLSLRPRQHLIRKREIGRGQHIAATRQPQIMKLHHVAGAVDAGTRSRAAGGNRKAKITKRPATSLWLGFGGFAIHHLKEKF